MTTINNKELNLFGISKVITFTASPSNYNNNGFWNEGTLKPIKGRKTETYRQLNTKFLFKGENRELILKNISRFIEECKDCIFERDNLYYEVEVNNSKEPEIINTTTYILEVEFSVLDVYQDEKSITTTQNTTISINSPKPCYANLELSADTNVISYTVTINDTEIVVKNIKGNETIYIGSGKVIAGGKSKINDVEMWQFPILEPGTNNITVNRADVNLKIKYNERW
ncbi:phage distal tail protein [Terrisporobacter sp.]|uniref:phage distal tail protein n=1 Tax=Terrisporobacter sp. TaxID=1965305 RepID=UPI00260519A3|nr:hypothetical protein [Terrisporobacter sp.]